MNCHNCGTQLKEGQKFCPKCGTKVEEHLCPNCHKPIQEGLKFCTWCGFKMEEDTASQEIVLEKPVYEERTCPSCHKPVPEGLRYCISCGHDMEAPEAPVKKVKCPHCGQEMDEGLKFCISCGKDLNEAPKKVEKPKKKSKKGILIFVFVLLLILGAAGGTYYYFSNKMNSDSFIAYVTDTENESNYSEEVLINQIMEDKGISKDKAQKAIKEANIDFNEAALNKVKSYIDSSKLFSKEAMLGTLVNENKFTEEQAEYALEKAEVDYVDNAKKQAKELFKDNESKKTLVDKLTEDYKYTPQEAQDGVNGAKINFKDACFQKSKSFKDIKDKDEMKKALSDEGFSEDEISYALDKIYDNKEEDKQESNNYDSSSVLIPDSSTRQISYADISGMNHDQIQTAINEIYARHGYIFKTPEILNHFRQYSWYQERTSDMAVARSEMNSTELRNIDFLTSYL